MHLSRIFECFSRIYGESSISFKLSNLIDSNVALHMLFNSRNKFGTFWKSAFSSQISPGLAQSHNFVLNFEDR